MIETREILTSFNVYSIVSELDIIKCLLGMFEVRVEAFLSLFYIVFFIIFLS